MELIDSHCHLNYKGLAENQADVLKRAKEQNITNFINICTNKQEAECIINTAEKYPEVFASIGIHPHDSENTLNEEKSEKLYDWLIKYSKHPKVVALGETGLDFYYNNSMKSKQIESFITHIEAAKKTKIPLVVHTRGASEDTIKLLQQEGKGVTGVIHCFSETEWLAEQALELGFYISISGIITFKKSQELRDIVKNIPIERLLLETDAPFLAPVPYRGKTNESAYMIETATLLAELKNIPLEEIAKITTQNCKLLFKKMFKD